MDDLLYSQPWKLVPNRIRGPGGRESDKLRGINPPVDDAKGSESWIGSVTRSGFTPPDDPNQGCAEVILPDGRKMYLFEAIALAPEKVLGEVHLKKHGVNLGMLIKYLDAQEPYGLQCHPTRPFAKKMWNSDFGKEESWYVIGLRDDVPDPFIILGFKEGVTREKWEKLYRAEDLQGLEDCCHKIPVKVGEAYFVGGGVPHALGKGCFVIEVQEPSDITVVPFTQAAIKRIFSAFAPKDEDGKEIPSPFGGEDPAVYDEKALGAFVYDGCSYEENLRRWRIPHKTIREGDWGKEYFIIGPDQTSYFSFTRADVKGKAALRQTGFPQVGIALRGSGVIYYDGGSFPIKQGDEIFLPYNIPGAQIEGDVSIVLCHPEGVNHGAVS
jgi:mannose-6-phosphate isomerase